MRSDFAFTPGIEVRRAAREVGAAAELVEAGLVGFGLVEAGAAVREGR